MISNRRLYITEGGDVVEDGDPRAHKLLVGEGCQIADALAKKLGITFPEPVPVPRALTEHELKVLSTEISARKEELKSCEEELKAGQERLAEDRATLLSEREALASERETLAMERTAFDKSKAVSIAEAKAKAPAEDKAISGPAEDKAVTGAPENKALSGPAETK